MLSIAWRYTTGIRHAHPLRDHAKPDDLPTSVPQVPVRGPSSRVPWWESPRPDGQGLSGMSPAPNLEPMLRQRPTHRIPLSTVSSSCPTGQRWWGGVVTRRYRAMVTHGAKLATRAHAPHRRPDGPTHALSRRYEPPTSDVRSRGAALVATAAVPSAWHGAERDWVSARRPSSQRAGPGSSQARTEVRP